MWSVKIRPKPGAAREAARDSASTMPPLGWTSNCTAVPRSRELWWGTTRSAQVGAGALRRGRRAQVDVEGELGDLEGGAVDDQQRVVLHAPPAAALGLGEPRGGHDHGGVGPAVTEVVVRRLLLGGLDHRVDRSGLRRGEDRPQ